MEKTCANCSTSFEITRDDLAFYDKVSPVFDGKKHAIPPPTHCPDCRTRTRYAFRNERKLYHRTCDATGKNIVSIYSPDKPFPVFDQHAWWSDTWDPLSYGQDIDFNRPFFEQFRELQLQVPRMSMYNIQCQNCNFCNQTYSNKDCYLCFAIKYCEGALYTGYAKGAKDCVDTAFCYDCELVFDSTDVYDCYNCSYVSQCMQCSDSQFLYDCIGCRNCFCCYGLRNKEYCIFNESLSKDEYAQRMQEYKSGSFVSFREYHQRFQEFCQEQPRLSAWIKSCENVTGNNMKNSRNCQKCYDSSDLEDCKRCTWTFEDRDCMECYGVGESELIYQSIGVEEVHSVAWSIGTGNSQNCYYTDHCFHSHDLFGCVGLQKAEYCVLNKQYAKDEYEELVSKLIAHMQSTQEWGEFFAGSVSPFAYNETIALFDYPLTKDEALEAGFQWKDDLDQKMDVKKIIPATQLPDSIDDIPDDILNWAIKCEATGRPFRIIKQELDFYRKMKLPVPHFHPDERHRRRMALRNPRKLWDRTCGKCQKGIQTTYAPDRPEIVYCEECYLKEVY